VQQLEQRLAVAAVRRVRVERRGARLGECDARAVGARAVGARAVRRGASLDGGSFLDVVKGENSGGDIQD